MTLQLINEIIANMAETKRLREEARHNEMRALWLEEVEEEAVSA